MPPPDDALGDEVRGLEPRARAAVLSANGARSKYPLRWERVRPVPLTRTFSRWNFPGPFIMAGSNASR